MTFLLDGETVWSGVIPAFGGKGGFFTLGNFLMKPTIGVLRIPGNKTGFALFGDEGYTDMALDVRFEIPKTGGGILLRATDVSLYDAQVQESYFGYSLTVSKLGVTLKRSRYGATGASSFEAVPAWADAETGELHIELRGNRVEVYLSGESRGRKALHPRPIRLLLH